MVHVVDNSFYGYGYREINQQLAKDNGELRQQLSLVVSENSQQREEIHRRDVQIIELKRQINELNDFKNKFEAIKDIVLDIRPVESHKDIETITPRLAIEGRHRQTEIENNEQSTQGTSSTTSADETTACNSTFDATEKISQNVLHRISERSEESSQSSSSSSPAQSKSTITPNQSKSHPRSQSSSSPSPMPLKTANNTPVNDSLDPPNVTSVPPLQPERLVHTPSVWNCLDTLTTPKQNRQNPENQENSSFNIGGGDMYQSTPIRKTQNVNKERTDESSATGKRQTTRYNLRKKSKVVYR